MSEWEHPQGEWRPTLQRLSAIAHRPPVAIYRLLFSILGVAPLWLFRYVPMTDAPNHLLAAFIAVHYNDPRFSFPTYFTLDLTPRSNILAHYVMILLLRAGLSPENTLRVLATLIVLLTVWGGYVLLRTARGSEHARTWFWLTVPLTYSWFFHQGFLNFSLSVALGLITLALGIGWGAWAPRPLAPASALRWAWVSAALALALYVTYLAHALGLAMALLAAGVLSLGGLVHTRQRQRAWPPLLARAAVAALPVLGLVALILGTARLSPNAQGEAGAFLSPPFIVWVPLGKKVAELRYGLLSFSPGREMWILAPAALLYLAAWGMSLRRPSWWHAPAVAALALYFALPMGFWVPFFIYERFWLFALFLGLLALPSLPAPDSRYLTPLRFKVKGWQVKGILLVTALAFLANLTNDYRIANRDLRAYDAVLAHLPERAWAFPFTYHHQGRISPARHFWAYAMMRQDVFIPMVFAETYHPVQYRPEIARPYPLQYEDGFFAEHARNRATLWVRVGDPLMQEVVIPKLPRHGYAQSGRLGPYLIYRLTTWPPPVPLEARPHITPDVAQAYAALLVYGYAPDWLLQEVEQFYRRDVQLGLASLYTRGQ